MPDPRETINEALATNGVVSIVYRDYGGNVTERHVKPLEWLDQIQIYGFCRLERKRRPFLLANILSCELVSSEDDTSAISTQSKKTLAQEELPAIDQPRFRKIRSQPQRSKEQSQSQSCPRSRFAQVTNGDEWSRLLAYYARCLEHENLQQYVIKNQSDQLYFYADREKVHSFLAGATLLEFHLMQASRPTRISTFAKRTRQRQHQQLCAGYPVFGVSDKEIAPLIFSRVMVEESDGRLVLRAEEPEPSYAALRQLGLKDEEISFVISESASIERQPGRSEVATLEEFLTSQLTEILGKPPEKLQWNGRGHPTIRKGMLSEAPCLFWVHDNIHTASLIKELRELAKPEIWDSVPTALKELLSEIPEHEYPGVPPFEEDNAIYVTRINERQRQAAAAMQSEHVTVVTGPPGTGKSQLVLNMVSQGVLRGETVLFASRINKAVDVVMDRLHGELEFDGAVRTGNWENRERAAKSMAAALSWLRSVKHPPSIPALRQRYRELKTDVAYAEQLLHRVRELDGLLDSYQSEREDLNQRLPKQVSKAAEAHAPEYRPEEVEHLQTMLSSLLITALGFRNEKEEIDTEILCIVRDNHLELPLLEALQHFEDQWGTFGGGFMHRQAFETLESTRDYCQQWLLVAPALETQSEITRLSHSCWELKRQYSNSLENLAEPLRHQVGSVESRFNLAELEELAAETARLARHAEILRENRQPIWEKLLARLHLKNPAGKVAGRIAEIERQVGLDSESAPPSGDKDLALLASVGAQLDGFLQACLLKRQLSDATQRLEGHRGKLTQTITDLPDAIRADIAKSELTEADSSPLVAAMEPMLAQTQTLIERRDQLASRVNAKLDGNQDSLQMLADLKATPSGKDKRLWRLNVPSRLEAIVGQLTKWRNLVSLWTTLAKIQHLNMQRQTLPTRSKAHDNLDALIKEQQRVGARTVRARWTESAQSLDTPTLQRASHYVSVLQQLSSGYDPNRYGEQKSAEEVYLPSALKVFPVWATTNLATRTNFPLTPGLFDTVIVDEASQCDIPSALPLLYRAKRIVVIGDPNQLRHVASIFRDSDYEAAAEYGIAIEAFLYSTCSLFDIAENSAGNRPGPLTLEEHYRSDPRIIKFSSEEFYGGELQIQTDMQRRRIPAEYAKVGCGAFWLHVDGTADHPPRGSASNRVEFEAIQSMVPRLLAVLNRHHMTDATLGIVTPYREQAAKLNNWVSRQFGDSKRILVGTAHTFQGNERDIMIFSPVLAPGLQEGSLKWLHRTENLLNVSVTRARNTLIVVGHWDFCKELPITSRYRHLAEYMDKRPNLVVREMDHLPIFGGEPFDVIGTLLDPTDREYNRQTLEKLIASCTDFVWWMDPYFQDHVFDLFWDVLQRQDLAIQDIRLLTSVQQAEPADGSKPRFSTDRAKTLQSELRRRGVHFEARLLPKNELPHDRHLYSLDTSLQMPPFGGAYGDHIHVSEYTESKTEPTFFDEYWNKAEKI